MQRFTLIFLLLFPAYLLAQVTSGTIVYEEVLNLRKRVEVDNPEIAAMLPDAQTDHKVLVFNAESSMYQKAPDGIGDQTYSSENEGMSIKMVIKRSEDALFRDFVDGNNVEQKEFMGKVFLIKGELGELKWKIGAEQKEVAGYLCQQAILDDTSRKVVAYFCPQIPVSAGPQSFGQLPGMIMYVDIDEGELIIAAKEVKEGEVDEALLVAPSKGKKVNREQFKKIVEEKQRELEETQGGNGSVIRIIERN